MRYDVDYGCGTMHAQGYCVKWHLSRGLDSSRELKFYAEQIRGIFVKCALKLKMEDIERSI